jgi:hypothetical protein
MPSTPSSASEAPIGGMRLLRNRNKTIGSLIFAVVCVLVAADLVANAVGHGHAHHALDDWVGAAVALAVAAVFFRVGQSRVVVTDGAPTFVVKNILQTHEIAWSDVQSIDHRASQEGGRVPTSVVIVHLRDGSSIRCTAIGGGYRVSSALESELKTVLASRMVEPAEDTATRSS